MDGQDGGDTQRTWRRPERARTQHTDSHSHTRAQAQRNTYAAQAGGRSKDHASVPERDGKRLGSHNPSTNATVSWVRAATILNPTPASLTKRPTFVGLGPGTRNLCLQIP